MLGLQKGVGGECGMIPDSRWLVQDLRDDIKEIIAHIHERIRELELNVKWLKDKLKKEAS